MYNVLLQGENVTVVIEDAAREYRPYVMTGGVSYNPRNAFWAMNKGKGQLDPILVPEAEELIKKAEARWSPKKKRRYAGRPYQQFACRYGRAACGERRG